MARDRTRRGLLLAGAALLGAVATRRYRAARTEKLFDLDASGVPGTDAPPQFTTPRILFAGEQLAQLSAAGLRLWSTRDWSATDLPLQWPCGLGRLSARAIAVMDQPDAGTGGVRLQRIERARVQQVWTGAVPVGRALTRITPGREGEARLLHFGQDGCLTRVRLNEDGSLLMTGFSSLPQGDGQAAMLEDHSLVYAWFGGLIRAGQTGCSTYSLPSWGRLGLLAPGSDDRLWLGTPGGAVALIELEDEVRPVWVERTGQSVFHLAAAGEQAFALLVGSDPQLSEPRWTLAAYGARHGELWRVPLATPDDPARTFVAASRDLVAVGGSDHLSVFQATDGAAVYA